MIGAGANDLHGWTLCEGLANSSAAKDRRQLDFTIVRAVSAEAAIVNALRPIMRSPRASEIGRAHV